MDEHTGSRILVVVYRCVQRSAAMHVHTVQSTPMLNKLSCQGSIPKETCMVKRAAASKEQITSTTWLIWLNLFNPFTAMSFENDP